MTEKAQIAPGAFVRCPHHPEWGLGQVQSVVGGRVTANFENAGMLVIELAHVPLTLADAAGPASGRPPKVS